MAPSTHLGNSQDARDERGLRSLPVDQRELLEQDVQRRRNDPEFVARVKARVATDLATLDRLARYDAAHR